MQLPLPRGINTQKVLEAIDPAKDADGLHPINLGRLVAGYNAPLPCTPRAIVELISHYKIQHGGAFVIDQGLGGKKEKPTYEEFSVFKVLFKNDSVIIADENDFNKYFISKDYSDYIWTLK